MSAKKPYFDIPVRIYYEDTDAGGIVYHASYIRFTERARTELLRHHGYKSSELENDRNLLFVVRHLSADYRKSAVLDDLLTIRTSVLEMRNSSVIFRQEIMRDDIVLCSLDVTIVTIDSKKFNPVRIPQDFRDIFTQYYDIDNDKQG